jgi:hypothetical protein
MYSLTLKKERSLVKTKVAQDSDVNSSRLGLDLGPVRYPLAVIVCWLEELNAIVKK